MSKLIDIALNEFGTKEISGKADNPEVLKYFDEIGFNGSQLKDETSWCSAFVNWVAKKGGKQRSNSLAARSWLKVGKRTLNPKLGDVVVFWREDRDSWKGHVALFIRETKNWVYVLGGNQNNQVKISAYRKYRVLEYRNID